MKKAKILCCLFLIPLLVSCNKQNTLEEEINELTEKGNLLIGMSLNDCMKIIGDDYYNTFGSFYSIGKFEYSERRGNVDVYTCGVMNGGPTEFYFRNNVNIGFMTRDPEFGFTLFGKPIGYPIFGAHGKWDDSLFTIFENRGYEDDPDTKEKKAKDSGIDDQFYYSWKCWKYKEKLHVAVASNVIYTLDGNMAVMEVLVDE